MTDLNKDQNLDLIENSQNPAPSDHETSAASSKSETGNEDDNLVQAIQKVNDDEDETLENGDENAEEEEEVYIPTSTWDAITHGIKETVDTFKAFAHAPKEIIGINIINIFEGMAYFGILTLLMLFMTKNVLVTDAPYVDITKLEISQVRACFDHDNIGGCVDVHAGWIVSGFLMLITFSQLFLGGLSDKLGPKKLLGISIVVLLLSRIVMGFSETLSSVFGTGIGSLFSIIVCGCLLFAALAYGVFNPAIYSLTRMYSDKKTSAVSYAMLYAGMNLGAFIIGLILPRIRHIAGDEMMTTETFGSGPVIAAIKQLIPSYDPQVVLHQGLMPGTNGYSGALIFIAGIMVIVLVLYFIFIARSNTKPLTDPKEESKSKKAKKARAMSLYDRIKQHPLADGKFSFFIFILIPVQTIFAYQNILIPTYLERSYRAFPTISDNYETFSNLNPLIVFLFTPIIAALTAKQNVYKMMIIGTAVMALPTFLLALGTTPALFLTFIFIGAIGESMWQPRFLQHVTEIAPKDKMGAYVGIANLPWFMTKFIVGLYVGFFIQGYIPDPTKYPDAVQNPQMMWFIFACIALISPIALFIASPWMNPKKSASKANA